jgi:hypothetical protein
VPRNASIGRLGLAALAAVAVLVGVLVATREPGGEKDQGGASAAPPARDAPGCARPYSDSSPWNTPVGKRPVVLEQAQAHVDSIEGPLTSDPTQYTYPVYEVASDDPPGAVAFEGLFSDVRSPSTLVRTGPSSPGPKSVQVPIGDSMESAAGSDAQIIILNPETGDEWGFWQLRKDEAGAFRATNGYHYNTKWSGVPPTSEDGETFGSRGAGVPYLAGLVRPCEIERGRIDHALAFAYSFPSSEFVYPATKSDGGSPPGESLPEGTRLQLDPALSDTDLAALGCEGACLTIAQALRRYGMYVIDNSGSSKVILEYEDTAGWDGAVSRETVSPIPLNAFRVVAPPERP